MASRMRQALSLPLLSEKLIYEFKKSSCYEECCEIKDPKKKNINHSTHYTKNTQFLVPELQTSNNKIHQRRGPERAN